MTEPTIPQPNEKAYKELIKIFEKYLKLKKENKILKKRIEDLKNDLLDANEQIDLLDANEQIDMFM